MKSIIAKAVDLLKAGELVAFPTETVYGLGADARNPDAILKVFAAKGRPADHPLIVHLSATADLSLWAIDIPQAAYRLAEAFWPGPLTLLLKKAKNVSPLITGGQDTIGLRVPNHPVTLTLLQAFGSGIVGPSANRFGHISPTQASHVQTELGDRVSLILEGGACAIGIESTIIDLSNDVPTLIRPGHITPAAIEAILQKPLATRSHSSPRASGTLPKHYAPITPTSLISAPSILELEESKEKIGVLTWSPLKFKNTNIMQRTLSSDPNLYAHDLYAALRTLDQHHLTRIYIENVPDTANWLAISDRLERAAS